MNYLASINIMPLKELLDPQGKTVANNLDKIDINGVQDVRIGKHIDIKLEASSEEDAKQKIETACKKLLSNVIMESYSYELSEI